MAEGWICPRCQLVLAPHVNEHRCDPPPPSIPMVVTGGGGGGGISTLTATGGTAYSVGAVT